MLAQCVSGSTSATLGTVWAQPMIVAAIPVALDSSDPARRQIGHLAYLGGWQLTSETRWFGGLSSLDIDGDRVTALSDSGAIVRFRRNAFGHIFDARIAPTPRACESGAAKEQRDTEALAHDPARSHWWIGYEASNRICRTGADFLRAERRLSPSPMAHWPRTGGPETVLRLRSSSFLVIAERPADDGDVRPALLFDRDPTDPAARVTELGYRPPDGMSPTDAAQFPDGRIIVLNRRFGLPSLFTAELVMLAPFVPRPHALLRWTSLASFAPPVISDNYEGVSAVLEGGRTVIWIVSDDNYMRWQRTLLLKFALVE